MIEDSNLTHSSYIIEVRISASLLEVSSLNQVAITHEFDL